MDQYIYPEFKLPEPGEGVINESSDFILREFTNGRLFSELKEGNFEALANERKVVEDNFDFIEMINTVT